MPGPFSQLAGPGVRRPRGGGSNASTRSSNFETASRVTITYSDNEISGRAFKDQKEAEKYAAQQRKRQEGCDRAVCQITIQASKQRHKGLTCILRLQ